MKKFRINGTSVLSHFDREISVRLIEKLSDQGLLKTSSSDIHSVTTKLPDGMKVIAHVAPWEVSLLRG